MKKHAAVFAVASVVATMCGAVAAQIPATRPRSPNITPLGPQAHRSPGQQQVMTGTIYGFVYWDSQLTSHLPSSVCNAFSVTVAVASKGPYGPFGAMGTQSHFTPMATAHPPLTSVNTTSYDGCAYAYNNAPLGQNLYVKLNLTQPLGTLLPATVMKNPAVGPIQFSNAPCSALPPLTKATVANLLGNWGSCQNVAYDVNLPLVIRQSLTILSSSGGMGANQGSHSGPLLNQTRPAGMLNNAAPQNTNSGSSPANGTLLPAVTPAPAQTPSMSQPGIAPGGSAQNVQLNPQPLPPRVQMTNADVIKMMSSRVPESVIISSIQSANHKFDFSPESCRQLQAAHVTTSVLAAMGDGSAPQCAAVPPGSAGAPPVSVQDCERSCTANCEASAITQGNAANCAKTCRERCVSKSSRTASSSRPIAVASIQSLEKARTPRLGQQNADIIAVLEQQRHAVETELQALNVSVRPVSSLGSAPATTMSATMPGRAPTQGAAPSSVQSPPADLTSRMTHPPAMNTLVLTCSLDPTPRVIRVNGGKGTGIFTPEPQYNHYAFVGCGFGQAQGAAHLFGSNGFTAGLNIDSWSDNVITAHLDPWFSGWLDQDNVTLVVNPIQKSLMQTPGLKFYAARGMPAPDGSDLEVQLAYDSLSQSSVRLGESQIQMGVWPLATMPFQVGYDQVSSNAISQFQSFSFQGNAVVGWLFRYAFGHQDGAGSSDCYVNDVRSTDQSTGGVCPSYFSYPEYAANGGVDYWNFAFVPGFEISSYQLHYGVVDPRSLCGAWDEYSHTDGRVGNWSYTLTTMYANGTIPAIKVTWPFYYCRDLEATERSNAVYQSAYGLLIWVMGPRCVDPWTGHSQQACIAQVKQTLGG